MIFYQTYWDVVKDDIFSMFTDFYNGLLDIAKLNRATICLISNISNAALITKFRLIGLLNYSYKIFSKVLDNRLHVALEGIIGEAQCDFLKNIYILDSVITAHEVLHHVHISKEHGLLFKVDFQKAFDFVNWGYLFDTFTQRGFSPLWVSWMKKLLRGGSVNVLVNGKLTDYFECRWGVRQGDHLSPYLFILVAVRLNKMIQRGVFHNHLVVGDSFKIINL
jgi:Reverse transcriptase (RNA-dependent DNA polymerase)